MHPAGSVRAMTRKAVRWIVDPPSRGDLALAAVLLVATAGLVVADAVAAAPALSWDWVDVAGVASTVAVAAAVAVRRTRPLWAGTAATVATTVAYSDGTPLFWIILVAWAMIAFAIGQSATPTTIVLVVAGAWAAETVEAALSGEPFTPVGPALLTVVVLIGSGAVARWRGGAFGRGAGVACWPSNGRGTTSGVPSNGNAPASRASCTTWWPTTSAGSWCRPARPCGSPTPARLRRG